MSYSYYSDPFTNQFNANGYSYESKGNGIVPLILEYCRKHYRISENRLTQLRKFLINNQDFGTDANGSANIVVESGSNYSRGIGNNPDTIFAICAAFEQLFQQNNHDDFTHELTGSIPHLTIRSGYFKRFSLRYYRVMGVKGEGATAIITLFDNRYPSREPLTLHGKGNGGLDAACKAINQIISKIVPLDLVLVGFNVNTLEESDSAPGQASITLRNGQGDKFFGQVIDNNILAASIVAYLNAINNYLDQLDSGKDSGEYCKGWYQAS